MERAVREERSEDQLEDTGEGQKANGKDKDNNPQQDFHFFSSMIKRSIPE
ncbi:hypothetical protein HW452_07980 [Halomonas aquamarina]|uniref:Uncharacterized protein n=1 Tax=Vreelandella aquamarina TaxID=77097 RepID=A0ACC5VTJ8_9GAMM|nr:hypothetical protein [Halomonas aquamarina]MBZ5487463.1 hypothetical protein [Halomonas aquamarina]